MNLTEYTANEVYEYEKIFGDLPTEVEEFLKKVSIEYDALGVSEQKAVSGMLPRLLFFRPLTAVEDEKWEKDEQWSDDEVTLYTNKRYYDLVKVSGKNGKTKFYDCSAKLFTHNGFEYHKDDGSMQQVQMPYRVPLIPDGYERTILSNGSRYDRSMPI